MFQLNRCMRSRKLFVLAGEVSGDMHAAEVIKVLRTRCPELAVFGTGGQKMRALGVDLLYDIDDLSVMGIVEVLRQGFFLRKVIRGLKKAIHLQKPDAALLVDYPGMNLVMAKYLHRLGIPVIYYISPKVWAWKEGRVRKIRDYVDRLMVIFDFEVEFFRKHDVRAEFAGNPVVEEIERLEMPSRKDFLVKYGIEEGRKIIGLLPGSRKQEIRYIFPEMLRAARILAEKYKTVFLLGRAPHVDDGLYDGCNELHGISLVDCSSYEVMNYSDMLLVTSGTATLEALCYGTPMIVLYKTGRLNYAIARRLVCLHSISPANLVAKGLSGKERVVPELIQHEMNAGKIVEEASHLLDDETACRMMRQELLATKKKLGALSPSGEVASAVCGYL
jgi:lipid-A-disaccharide synthase